MTTPDAETERALLAEIYAAPYDDTPRMVYADWLLQRGDPRGELIQLQLGPRTSDVAGREKRLLAQFAERWIGGLPATRRTAVFRRGFVAKVTRLADWSDDPAWGTIEEHDVLPPRDSCHDQALRVAYQIHSSSFTELAGRTRPLAVEDMTWSFLASDPAWHETAAATRVFRETELLPALRRLRIEPYHHWDRVAVAALDWLLDAPTFARLRELSVPLAPAQLGAMIDRMGGLERLIIEAWSGGRCEIGARSRALRVVIPARRTDLSALRAVLADGVGGRVTRATLVVPAAATVWFSRQRGELERAVGCELVVEQLA